MCITCENGVGCTCDIGYVTNGKNCLGCPDNCIKCAGEIHWQTECLECEENYYLTEAGTFEGSC